MNFCDAPGPTTEPPGRGTDAYARSSTSEAPEAATGPAPVADAFLAGFVTLLRDDTWSSCPFAPGTAAFAEWTAARNLEIWPGRCAAVDREDDRPVN